MRKTHIRATVKYPGADLRGAGPIRSGQAVRRSAIQQGLYRSGDSQYQFVCAAWSRHQQPHRHAVGTGYTTPIKKIPDQRVPERFRNG